MMDLQTFIFGDGVKGLPLERAAKLSKRRYVRAEDEMAVYEAERGATGHVLTAWEAYTAFGPDKLEEAVEWSSAILIRTPTSTRDALKRRRKELGVSTRSVARAARVRTADVELGETRPRDPDATIQNLERIAFTLGLDERFLAFKTRPGGDGELAYRLMTLQRDCPGISGSISAGTALLFAEASSVIRVQRRLQKWLGIESESDKFSPSYDYGSPQTPAWRVGYNLAQDARRALGLGNEPIRSMRELVEERLGIPVAQARLPNGIAGATVVSVDEDGEEARGRRSEHGRRKSQRLDSSRYAGARTRASSVRSRRTTPALAGRFIRRQPGRRPSAPSRLR